MAEQRPNLIYTPERHIPIGEAVKTEAGVHGIKMKKAGGKDTEIITLTVLSVTVPSPWRRMPSVWQSRRRSTAVSSMPTEQHPAVSWSILEH